MCSRYERPHASSKKSLKEKRHWKAGAQQVTAQIPGGKKTQDGDSLREGSMAPAGPEDGRLLRSREGMEKEPTWGGQDRSCANMGVTGSPGLLLPPTAVSFSYPARETLLQCPPPSPAALESMSMFCPLTLVSLFHRIGFSSSSRCCLVVGSRSHSRFPLGLPLNAVAPLPWEAGRRGHISLRDSPFFRELASQADRCPHSPAHPGAPKPVTAPAPSRLSVCTSLPSPWPISSITACWSSRPIPACLLVSEDLTTRLDHSERPFWVSCALTILRLSFLEGLGICEWAGR